MSKVFARQSKRIGWIYVYHDTFPNPVSFKTLHSLVKAFDGFSELDVIILTGVGKSFLSGANISDMLNFDYENAWEFSALNELLSNTIKQCKAITIAAVNGYCFGGANDIALACDMRVAGKDALFGHTGAKIGILTGWGGTYLLPKAIGTKKAYELFFSAKRLTAQEALDLNLINRVFDSAHFYSEVNQFAKGCLQRVKKGRALLNAIRTISC